MDFINLPKVLRNQEILEAGQNIIEEDDIPMVIYNLSQPIRSTILHYDKFEIFRNLFGKGPNFREPVKVDFDVA